MPIEIIHLPYNHTETKRWEIFAPKKSQEMISAIKKFNWYKKGLLFRGFDIQSLKRLLKTGHDLKEYPDHIYAGQEGHIAYDPENVLQYAWRGRGEGILSKLKRNQNHFAVSIYDPKYFEKITLKGRSTFKENSNYLDALKSIVRFIPEKNNF